MKVIGLTGSIATGKSTVARMCVREGAALFDADAYVHQLMQAGGRAEAEVLKLFPDSKGLQGIDRRKLGQIVFSEEAAMDRLESILHPYVFEGIQEAVRKAEIERRPYIVCDIPLLFETMDPSVFDIVLVTTVPTFLQRQRVLSRPHMSDKKLQVVLSRQMPQYEKIRYADYVIPTGIGRAHSLRSVRSVLHSLHA